MNGTLEQQNAFLEGARREAGFNVRLAMHYWMDEGMTARDAMNRILASQLAFAAQQAKEAGYDDAQTVLFIQAHHDALDAVATQFGVV